MTFVLLNEFCLLTPPPPPPPPPPLLLMDNIKIDGMPTKPKKKLMPFLHCISTLEGTLYDGHSQECCT